MRLTQIVLRGRGGGGFGGGRGGRGFGFGRGGAAKSPPPRAAPPRAAPPRAAPAPAAAPGRGSGLMGQMAATAGGVAIGSVVGHGLSQVTTKFIRKKYLYDYSGNFWWRWTWPGRSSSRRSRSRGRRSRATSWPRGI